ncbi:hypothetical protein IWQ60_012222 [Tieghemiomyces parasiticus]|uniref:Uncharacterized protein n=1 Tax=Tieghemiomyces parasiticus TaxID=78921 RepID=A0A9W7ZM35_9FUNG|nr:hypothetical protein IWQ60_012222 [Tieghemiomyces parasiticus]
MASFLRLSALRTAARTAIPARSFSASPLAAMVNQVTLVGRVGSDPEVRAFDNGNSVAQFNMVTTDVFKNKEDEVVERTQWHRIKNYAQHSQDWMADKLKKGSLVYVVGSIRTDTYNDKEGVERNVSYIRSDRIKVLHNRKPVESEGAGEHSSE